MTSSFVPPDFVVPTSYRGRGFRLEPLGAFHNQRDYAAWTSSREHIESTPGFEGRDWPHEMSLEENLSDLLGHAEDFAARTGFTYSILDGHEIIGCLYIYPSTTHDAEARSWVCASRADMDRSVWLALSGWLAEAWPFARVEYAARD